jgi:predicted alpha/beta superfamily hydrolase
MKRILFIAFIALCLVSCESKKTPEITIEEDNPIVLGQKDVIYSNILKEDREIWIHLPESAMDDPKSLTKYPVLYLLDGPGHFYSVTGMIKQLSTTNGNTIVPEMIIIGIPNTDRSRDMTPTHVETDFFTGDSIQYASGGGNKFLDFMEDELMPYIEKTYPVSTYKTFVGHSFGGLAVINALINRPDLFNNYVAIDPSLWWDDEILLRNADSVLTENKFDGKALYVGVANTMNEGMTINEVRSDTAISSAHIRSILQFVNSTETKNDNGLLFKWKYYENDSHGSVPLIAEYDALRFLFPWYELKGLNKFFEPSSTASTGDLLNVIGAHYKNVSNHFGIETLPPEPFINSLGYRFMGDNKLDKANAMFKLNIRNYPNTSNVYDSMGDSYLAQNDSIKALELFTTALEVGDNDFSQEKLTC